MQINDIFNNKEDVKQILAAIHAEASPNRTYRIMEVCGTHTMSIARHGLPSLLPSNVKLVSGPGCPVCVTSQADIDNCIDLSDHRDVTITTFGDMLRVMGTDRKSLYSAKAEGADVRIIYSPLDTIAMAKANPDRKHIFIAVGFETTAPMAAGLVKMAHAEGLNNISILSMCKTMPQAFHLLLTDDTAAIDGFLCPGNVSVVTGLSIYEPIVKANKAAVVAGFEPMDILSSVLEIIRQVNSGNFSVMNNYLRACKAEGNLKAQALINEIFIPADSRWRGLGVLPNSGLAVRDEYAIHDAAKVFNLDPNREERPTACKCGDILKGKILPKDCPLFATKCTPESAVGPCMVSSEGACAAHYKYSLRNS
ncbi:MAG: hydrogenase formation protein HypD [Deferribacteraceae bacterium]|jgi:hydrogenase expression/formation protein HypD|nr:hydrogenase formation protein HypD [Deferribacteraceae bacterium]